MPVGDDKMLHIHGNYSAVDSKRHNPQKEGKRDVAFGLKAPKGPPVAEENADNEYLRVGQR